MQIKLLFRKSLWKKFLILFLIAGCSSTSLLFDSANEKYSEGDYTGAISDLSRVLKLEPDNYEAYLKRGKAYSNLGKHKIATVNGQKVQKDDSLLVIESETHFLYSFDLPLKHDGVCDRLLRLLDQRRSTEKGR